MDLDAVDSEREEGENSMWYVEWFDSGRDVGDTRPSLGLGFPETVEPHKPPLAPLQPLYTKTIMPKVGSNLTSKESDPRE